MKCYNVCFVEESVLSFLEKEEEKMDHLFFFNFFIKHSVMTIFFFFFVGWGGYYRQGLAYALQHAIIQT